MKSDRPRPQSALVIRWPHSVAPVAAREAARRLGAGGAPATWSIDQASQAETLAAWGAARAGAEIALGAAGVDRAGLDPNPDAAPRELARRLDVLRASGLNVEIIHGGADLTAGAWPRALRALGVHGVIVEGAPHASPPKALPFGVWQFVPQATAPRPARWFSWLARRRPAFQRQRSLATVTAIDLVRVGAPGSRSWREMEAVLEEAAQAGRAGELTTIGGMADRLTSVSGPRPQRSILRAAA